MNKALTVVIVMVLPYTCVETSATIFRQCIGTRRIAQRLETIDISPIKYKSFLEHRDQYPTKLNLGLFGQNKTPKINYLSKDENYSIQLYGKRKIDIENNGSIRPWSSRFKILEAQNIDIDDNSENHNVNVFNDSEIEKLKSFEIGKKYLTEDKKYIIKRKTNENYKVYDTKELIRKGSLIDFNHSSERIYYDKQDLIFRLRILGIEFTDSQKYPINSSVLNDIVEWIEKFNIRYPGFKAKNNFMLSGIFIQDDIIVHGDESYSELLYYKEFDFSQINLSSRFLNELAVYQEEIFESIKYKRFVNNFNFKSNFVHEYGHYIEESINRAKKK